MCLDVLRALRRAPAAADLLFDEMRDAAGADKRLRMLLDALRDRAGSIEESRARAFVRDLVIALQASLLIRHSPSAIAEGFCASRLTGGSERSACFRPASIRMRSSPAPRPC